MFDAKIQQIVDMLSSTIDGKIDIVEGKVDDKIENVKDILYIFKDDLGRMSRQTKIAIGLSLGLSVVDTILLFAIFMRLGR